MLIANDLAKLKELHDNRVLTLQTNRGCSATAGTEHTVSPICCGFRRQRETASSVSSITSPSQMVPRQTTPQGIGPKLPSVPAGDRARHCAGRPLPSCL